MVDTELVQAFGGLQRLNLGLFKPLDRSLFLELPLEVMILIVEWLPLQCQLLTAQTCSAMRELVLNFCLEGDNRLPKNLGDEARLEYLVCIARTLPDRWVCHACVKFHATVEFDTPADPRCHPSCPFGVKRLREQGCGHHGFNVNHRHLQLTLKLSRLASNRTQHKRYLKRLVRPYHSPFRPRSAMEEAITGEFSAYPKVVEGRYLLFSVRSYHQAIEGSLSQEAMGSLVICKHQHTFNYRLFAVSTKLNAFQDSLAARRSHPLMDPADSLNKTIFEAIETMEAGDEAFGSCPSCATDFSVQSYNSTAVVRVWQDLGPEGTLLDPFWRAMADPLKGATVAHEPGSVREKYGNVDQLLRPGDEERMRESQRLREEEGQNKACDMRQQCPVNCSRVVMVKIWKQSTPQ